MPFTMIAEPGTKVALSCVIFRRVTAALAGLQASVSGYSIPRQHYERTAQPNEAEIMQVGPPPRGFYGMGTDPLLPGVVLP